MAEAEIEKKEKRQREGIQAKKDRGDWDNCGRPRVISVDEFNEEYKAVESGEMRPFELMKKLGMTKATFYRYTKMIKKGLIHKTLDKTYNTPPNTGGGISFI